MDSPDAGIIPLLALLLIFVNAFFATAETALLEARKSRLEKIGEGGDLRAMTAISALEEPDRLLATAQIGITLSAILAGVLASLGLAPFLMQALGSVLSFPPYISLLSLTVSIAVVSYLILLLAGSIPKKIARQHPESQLLRTLGVLSAIERFLRPFTSILTLCSDALLVLLGVSLHVDDNVTEDEVKDLIEQGTEEGTFEKEEQDMVDRIFRMSDQTAYALMTPRTQLFWLDLEDSLEHNLQLIHENPDTVFPVGRDNLDDFEGVLYAKDLLNAVIEGPLTDFLPYIRKPMFIPRSMETFRVLEKFRESGIHEAVVLDEYGGVVGFLTLRDVVSEIIGDLADSTDPEPIQITPRDENSWLVDGLYDIDDFKEKFDLDKLPDEDRAHYQTMGGFLTSYFGYIPKVAEKCEWNGFVFEIVDMDRARIDKILVTYKKDPAAPSMTETATGQPD